MYCFHLNFKITYYSKMEKYTNFKQRSNLNNKGIIKTCFNILEEKVRKYIFYY